MKRYQYLEGGAIVEHVWKCNSSRRGMMGSGIIYGGAGGKEKQVVLVDCSIEQTQRGARKAAACIPGKLQEKRFTARQRGAGDEPYHLQRDPRRGCKNADLVIGGDF